MSTQSRISERGETTAATVTYDLDKTATRDIRQAVRQELAGYRGPTVDDAVLVADEMISNAHRHGDGPRACRLELGHHGGYLRIEVDDTSPRQPVLRTPSGSGGRGLLLIDRISSIWGVDNHTGHKTTWAELALDRE
ncbi:ATP-binding protein [Amycolatopsis sp. lyj-112]|uniref:ATP-binding protein n=1 Tax=Amycolatopsis sp. lyj-112 TaxID=2789288 RepID=UPI00397DE75D